MTRLVLWGGLAVYFFSSILQDYLKVTWFLYPRVLTAPRCAPHESSLIFSKGVKAGR